ncbi:hypothetical protein, partial [Acinetobacter bereziniae]|uniref:hypothetical protein n=1 Tax=Acinetobacter bereziniae TaxID=106648 RepID=UPI003AF651ED
RALYRRSLEYGLGITAVSKVFYSVANFIYLAIITSNSGQDKTNKKSHSQLKIASLFRQNDS